MLSSRKQTILWLVVLIGLIAGVSYLTVSIIKTSQPWIINGLTVSCLVAGVLLLMLFTRIQRSEYAYPMWCVFTVIIGLTVAGQLLIKYWNLLLVIIIGKQHYWLMMAGPTQIYILVAWALLAILIFMGICWLLLRATKSFVIFGFYELAALPVLAAFSLWVVGLDSYQTPALLKTLGFELANDLNLTNEHRMAPWLVTALLAIFMLIKIIIATLYRRRWRGEVQRLIWVAIIIWLVLLLANPALTDLSMVLLNRIGVIGVLLGYLIVTTAVSLLAFHLSFKKINDQAVF